MARKSLMEIAEVDRQVARFLEREANNQNANTAVASQEASIEGACKLAYAQNHLPKARNISSSAQVAINACILG